MENSNPDKNVTPENFILKLGTRDYVEEVTYQTIFDANRFSGASPQIDENINLCDFFSVGPTVLFFLDPTPS